MILSRRFHFRAPHFERSCLCFQPNAHPPAAISSKTAAASAPAVSGLALLPQTAFSEDAEVNIIGPKKGYSPQIGTLVSMMTWMRMVVLIVR